MQGYAQGTSPGPLACSRTQLVSTSVRICRWSGCPPRARDTLNVRSVSQSLTPGPWGHRTCSGLPGVCLEMFGSLVASLSRAVPLAFLGAASALALELPLPPPGEDVVGQVRTVVSRYEDTFAGIAEANDLGYLELVAANPGVDPWLPRQGTGGILPSRYIRPPGPREGIVINLAEYRLYYYPKDRPVVYTYPLGIGREGWSSPVTQTRITAKTPNPAWYPPKSIREEHAAEGDPL